MTKRRAAWVFDPNPSPDTLARERRDAIQRMVDRLHTFLCGLGPALGVSGRDVNRDDTLAAMDDMERAQFLEIERLMGLRAISHEARERLRDVLSGRHWDPIAKLFRYDDRLPDGVPEGMVRLRADATSTRVKVPGGWLEMTFVAEGPC